MTTLEIVLIVSVSHLWALGAFMTLAVIAEPLNGTDEHTKSGIIAVAVLWPVILTSGLVVVVIKRIRDWRKGNGLKQN